MKEERVFNFSAGPAILPIEVLQKAKQEMLSLKRSGMSVMEISHRSKEFKEILEKTKLSIKQLLKIGDDYEILFFSGGASLQFALIPLNFLNKSADFVVTGHWSMKAFQEAKKLGVVNLIYSSEKENFSTTPRKSDLKANPSSDYVHYCSNETIDGVEFKYDLEVGNLPVVCDASSNIMSKPIDIKKYALIYAGAQKNLGPSGITLVIVQKDFLSRAKSNLPTMLSYKSFAEHDSMPNTPNTWGIYLIGLVCDWLREKGGLERIAEINLEKAKLIYKEIDESNGFYRSKVEPSSRSTMNVTFSLPSKELDEKFCAKAEEIGLRNLKGHRSVGGIRASIYNAFPLEGVIRLVEFMRDFRRKYS
ncbi:MAG: 3-phosphoserine/phosphohydroxythreonine transaminase [Pyrinomonadaceae bacterium]|nr:3-phosphoserine/phosphohydroxythreonine transaminase [Pyrinomonadaceae bacterium]MCX7640225.1 3-phosphoserine/phosphohydroxythreonine transaminase [Pyrinomonadaceae bacterium]MDW8303930.1 3-phosphoserine/phosphohydroxythreonine transaminase [Acidobacteriota bacterium]